MRAREILESFINIAVVLYVTFWLLILRLAELYNLKFDAHYYAKSDVFWRVDHFLNHMTTPAGRHLGFVRLLVSANLDSLFSGWRPKNISSQ